MTCAITALCLWFAVTDLPAGTELKYVGTLSQQGKSGPVEVKSFTLYAVTGAAADGLSQLAYYLEERGAGFGWPERFGLISSNSTESHLPRILYSLENQQYVMPVRSPLFEFRDKLALNAAWTEGRRQYAVTRQKKVMDREGWQVEVTSNLGRNQTLVVDATSGLLLSLEERVIIGRGDEFQLKLDLQSEGHLNAEEAAKNSRVLQSLVKVQSSLNRSGDQKVVELSREQLDVIRGQLPQIEQDADGTAWSRLVAAIGRDLPLQQKRLDGVASLKKRLVGQSAPDWTLKLIDGKRISSDDTKDKVVVLHFWQYRGEPLNEPYGQIGYLDFLNSKRKKIGAVVIGVNVDERFANPQQAAVASRSMRSLLDFMKISYDMATDDGTMLAEFGDPRATGAPLPLWVVIGHDGKVAHHHTGFYDIKPDEGLKQLDEAVVEALRRQKSPSGN